jgi:hypothetical protein
MNRTSSVRKQNSSGHFSPKSPDYLPDSFGSLIRIEQKLVRSVSRSLTTESSWWNPKRRRLWPTPGCNAMEEDEEEGCEFLNIICITITWGSKNGIPIAIYQNWWVWRLRISRKYNAVFVIAVRVLGYVNGTVLFIVHSPLLFTVKIVSLKQHYLSTLTSCGVIKISKRN